MEPEEIKLDTNNYRLHNDRNKGLIKKSLTECGAGRSVLIDNEDCLIAGNGVYEQAQKLGIPIRVVETDGNELVVVKRTDLGTNDDKRKLLSLVDNHTSDTSEFDYGLIAEDFSTDLIADWDIDISFDSEDTEDGDIYTNKIKSPIYEPKNEQPDLTLLANTAKTDNLVEDIKASDIPNDIKEFLIIAAQRHTVFNYSSIADYYAHSNDDVKALMQRSALVIVDFDKAIEEGFIQLTKRISSIYMNDHEE